jgi:Rad3-related DNA helicase
MVARVRSQGDACLGRACSHSDSCPVEIARGYARRADIIVANHALTFADAKTTVFPPYSRLIFDEAQNIEAAATEGLALECSSYGLSQLARTLADDPNSLMRVMERKLANLGGAVGVAEAADALRAIPPATDQLLNAASEFGATLCEFCFLASQDRRAEEGRTTIRLTTQTRALPEWHETAEMGGVAHAAGTALFGVMADFVKRLGEVDKGGQPGAEGIEADAFAMKTRLEEQLVALNTVLNATGDSTEYVTWADTWRSARGQQWGLHAAPVDVGPVLDEALYQHKAGIVFTSATVTVDGEFRYFRQRLGLDEYSDKLQEMRASSPFDLTEQLLLCIPTDMPDAAEREFNEKTADALRDICEATEGGTLALFTARSRMQQAFQRLEADLEGLGLTPLCQDVSGARWALLERLKQDPRAVLFGLKSFWEGVDVPGDALRCVVICKLPFAVPSDPIIEARQEDAARKGLNPMQDYYIPEAVIGFKQGFGRLIRTTTDTGVVFVLDKRILTKPYGRRFFRSIERCELMRDSLEECLAQARGWLRK